MSIQLDDKTATVYTDSQTTLDSLINNRIHTSLIEEIRRKAHEMENKGRKIRFRWKKDTQVPGETSLPTSLQRRPQQTQTSPHVTAECLKV